MDDVTPKDFKYPIIKMDFVSIIEETLGIEGRRATHGGKMVHLFKPPIMVHISQRLIVE